MIGWRCKDLMKLEFSTFVLKIYQNLRYIYSTYNNLRDWVWVPHETLLLSFQLSRLEKI